MFELSIFLLLATIIGTSHRRGLTYLSREISLTVAEGKESQEKGGDTPEPGDRHIDGFTADHLLGYRELEEGILPEQDDINVFKWTGYARYYGIKR